MFVIIKEVACLLVTMLAPRQMEILVSTREYDELMESMYPHSDNVT